jgi:hypothetical protein
MAFDVVEDSQARQRILVGWLSQRVPSQSWEWLMAQVAIVASGGDDRVFYRAFSQVTRQLGKVDLQLSAAELASAAQVCPGWQPENWTVDQAARSLLLLAMPQADAAQVGQRFEQLYTTAGLPELIALLQTLPLLPDPDRYRYWADEGLRSHITAVFNAIAHRNPYPAQHLNQATWNHLVLKALFVDSPLHLITGLDQRRNADLAVMLIDYVHERWAAGRRVTPELWRLLSPFLTPAMLPDLARGLRMNDRVQQLAIGRCCVDADDPAALALLCDDWADNRVDLLAQSQQTTWEWVYHNRQDLIPVCAAPAMAV